MKHFSLLVRVPKTYTIEQAESVYPQWENVVEQWKTQNVYVLSFAFPGESHTIVGPENAVKNEPVWSGNLRVVSNIVLQCETIAKALEHAKACPILKYGGSVEVREIPNPVALKE